MKLSRNKITKLLKSHQQSLKLKKHRAGAQPRKHRSQRCSGGGVGAGKGKRKAHFRYRSMKRHVQQQRQVQQQEQQQQMGGKYATGNTSLEEYLDYLKNLVSTPNVEHLKPESKQLLTQQLQLLTSISEGKISSVDMKKYLVKAVNALFTTNDEIQQKTSIIKKINESNPHFVNNDNVRYALIPLLAMDYDSKQIVVETNPEAIEKKKKKQTDFVLDSERYFSSSYFKYQPTTLVKQPESFADLTDVDIKYLKDVLIAEDGFSLNNQQTKLYLQNLLIDDTLSASFKENAKEIYPEETEGKALADYKALFAIFLNTDSTFLLTPSISLLINRARQAEANLNATQRNEIEQYEKDKKASNLSNLLSFAKALVWAETPVKLSSEEQKTVVEFRTELLKALQVLIKAFYDNKETPVAPVYTPTSLKEFYELFIKEPEFFKSAGTELAGAAAPVNAKDDEKLTSMINNPSAEPPNVLYKADGEIQSLAEQVMKEPYWFTKQSKVTPLVELLALEQLKDVQTYTFTDDAVALAQKMIAAAQHPEPPALALQQSSLAQPLTQPPPFPPQQISPQPVTTTEPQLAPSIAPPYTAPTSAPAPTSAAPAPTSPAPTVAPSSSTPCDSSSSGSKDQYLIRLQFEQMKNQADGGVMKVIGHDVSGSGAVTPTQFGMSWQKQLDGSAATEPSGPPSQLQQPQQQPFGQQQQPFGQQQQQQQQPLYNQPQQEPSFGQQQQQPFGQQQQQQLYNQPQQEPRPRRRSPGEALKHVVLEVKASSKAAEAATPKSVVVANIESADNIVYNDTGRIVGVKANFDDSSLTNLYLQSVQKSKENVKDESIYILASDLYEKNRDIGVGGSFLFPRDDYLMLQSGINYTVQEVIENKPYYVITTSSKKVVIPESKKDEIVGINKELQMAKDKVTSKKGGGNTVGGKLVGFVFGRNRLQPGTVKFIKQVEKDRMYFLTSPKGQLLVLDDEMTKRRVHAATGKHSVLSQEEKDALLEAENSDASAKIKKSWYKNVEKLAVGQKYMVEPYNTLFTCTEISKIPVVYFTRPELKIQAKTQQIYTEQNPFIMAKKHLAHGYIIDDQDEPVKTALALQAAETLKYNTDEARVNLDKNYPPYLEGSAVNIEKEMDTFYAEEGTTTEEGNPEEDTTEVAEMTETKLGGSSKRTRNRKSKKKVRFHTRRCKCKTHH